MIFDGKAKFFCSDSCFGNFCFSKNSFFQAERPSKNGFGMFMCANCNVVSWWVWFWSPCHVHNIALFDRNHPPPWPDRQPLDATEVSPWLTGSGQFLLRIQDSGFRTHSKSWSGGNEINVSDVLHYTQPPFWMKDHIVRNMPRLKIWNH